MRILIATCKSANVHVQRASLRKYNTTDSIINTSYKIMSCYEDQRNDTNVLYSNNYTDIDVNLTIHSSRFIFYYKWQN